MTIENGSGDFLIDEESSGHYDDEEPSGFHEISETKINDYLPDETIFKSPSNNETFIKPNYNFLTKHNNKTEINWKLIASVAADLMSSDNRSFVSKSSFDESLAQLEQELQNFLPATKKQTSFIKQRHAIP